MLKVQSSDIYNRALLFCIAELLLLHREVRGQGQYLAVILCRCGGQMKSTTHEDALTYLARSLLPVVTINPSTLTSTRCWLHNEAARSKSH